MTHSYASPEGLSLQSVLKQSTLWPEIMFQARSESHTPPTILPSPIVPLLALELWDTGLEGKGQKGLELLPRFWLQLLLSNRRAAGKRMFAEPIPCARHPLFHFILPNSCVRLSLIWGGVGTHTHQESCFQIPSAYVAQNQQVCTLILPQLFLSPFFSLAYVFIESRHPWARSL